MVCDQDSQKRASVGSYVFLILVIVLCVLPDVAYADLEGSIRNIKSELTDVVLPLLSVCGLVGASFSYITANPNSKQHVTYALIGAGIGFGAESIINLIRSLVH